MPALERTSQALANIKHHGGGGDTGTETHYLLKRRQTESYRSFIRSNHSRQDVDVELRK